MWSGAGPAHAALRLAGEREGLAYTGGSVLLGLAVSFHAAAREGPLAIPCECLEAEHLVTVSKLLVALSTGHDAVDGWIRGRGATSTVGSPATSSGPPSNLATLRRGR